MKSSSTNATSTEDIDKGETGGTGGVNPGSSNEKSLVPENTKKGHDEGEQRTENYSLAPPLFHCKIRKSHYVYI